MASPIILNIPHASTLIPYDDIPFPYHEPKSMAYWQWGGRKKVRGEIMARYLKEIPYMTDWYTDELFINGIGKPLVASISRLLCDTERYIDDNKEEMSVIGMGICYTSDHNLDNLVSFKLEHKLNMIEKYYKPYHRTLSHYTGEAIKEHKVVFILDCHSFSNMPYKCDQNFAYDRPDICIGTDPEHTPQALTSSLVSYFENFGYTVKENYPFSGTMIPEGYENNPNLFSLMIEINRNLYLDRKGGDVKKKDAEFSSLKERIYGAEKLIEDFMSTNI